MSRRSVRFARYAPAAGCALAIVCAAAALICCQAFGSGDTEGLAIQPVDAQAAGDGATLLEASNGTSADGSLDKDAHSSSPTDAGPDPVDASSPRRVAFVTTDEMSGNLGPQPSAWDLLCTSRANDAGVKGVFVAWISTPGSLAITRLENAPVREWRDTKGTLITTGATPVAAGVALNINTTERAQPNVGGTSVWTGTFEDGGASPNNCNQWTSPMNGNGDVGEVGGAGRDWTANKSESCGNSNHIYCFQK